MSLISLVHRSILSAPVLALACLIPSAAAAPIGTLNVDSCAAGVVVTATMVDFTDPCIQAGAGTNVTSTFGNITQGQTGLISDLVGALPQIFMTFDPPGGTTGNLVFTLTAVGPGSSNTNCAAPPCSIIAGSPFIIDGSVSSTVQLPVAGTSVDAGGTTNWVGRFSANFPGLSPLQLQQQFQSSGQLSATTYSGSIVLTAVPEPGSWVSLLSGLILIGTALQIRRRTLRP